MIRESGSGSDGTGTEGDGETGTPVANTALRAGRPGSPTSRRALTRRRRNPAWAGGDGGEPEVVVETTSAEEAALKRARTVSALLDEAIRVPGTESRVGLDPVLGGLAGYGDAGAAAISVYPVFEAYRLDAPKRRSRRC